MPSWAGVTTSQPGRAASSASRVLGQRDAARDRVAERGQAEHAHREPQLERAPAARQLERAVAEVDLAAGHVAQVRAVERERPLQQPRLADEHAAELVGLEEPLVRVEHERVGALEAREQRPPGGAEHRGGAVRAVDVQPQGVLGAHVRELRRADRSPRCSSSRPSPRRRTAAGRPRDRPAPPPGAPPPGAGTRRRTAAAGPARERSRGRRGRARWRRAPGRTGTRPPRDRGRPPRRALRAAASAVIVPTEPPLTIAPSDSAGSPQRSRSQSTTTSSTVAAPAPPPTSRRTR